ncbi:MAG TPA: thiol peroxidase [Candidatus Baltobacteraceae bacterium]|nr:thiol peroxidase [Candidatus Baltobacteraceae bacterium]
MATQTIERPGIVTGRGNPLTLLGPQLNTGDTAPEVHLSAADLSIKTLDDLTDHGKRAVLLIVVPSLDTPTCSIESRKFNQRLSELPASVKPYIVSVDLPFAMTRWSGAEGNFNIDVLSDYRDHSFGYAYGVRIKETGLLMRSNFLIGPDRKIHYVEIVPEISQEPDYEATFAAARAIAT